MKDHLRIEKASGILKQQSKAYSKPAGEGFAIETEVVALLKDLVQAKFWVYQTLWWRGLCCYLIGGQKGNRFIEA